MAIQREQLLPDGVDIVALSRYYSSSINPARLGRWSIIMDKSYKRNS
jgi:hypothetical protein